MAKEMSIRERLAQRSNLFRYYDSISQDACSQGTSTSESDEEED